jgi:hypothetical protein
MGIDRHVHRQVPIRDHLVIDPLLRRAHEAGDQLGEPLRLVLGGERALGLAIAGLEMAMEAGRLRRQPVRPLAHLLLAAIGEAGMVIANASDPRAARAEVEPPPLALLEGLEQG